MKVIITGSLGHIGKPLTEELVKKGHTITVISSKPDKQKEIESLGATAAIGALEDADFLAFAFNGADAIYAMVPPNYFTVPDMREYYQQIGHNYAKAIQQTGVKRVVHLSSYGADLDKDTGFILGAHDVEGILNELTNVSVTHLRAGYFYYNLYNFKNMIKEAGFIGSNYGGDDKLVLAHPKDIAAAAAEELSTPDAGNKVRYVISDERTCSETARVLGAAIGKPDLSWVIFTKEQTQSALEKSGMPAHVAADFAELGAGIHSGILQQHYELHKPAKLGEVKLEEFAREFAAAF